MMEGLYGLSGTWAESRVSWNTLESSKKNCKWESIKSRPGKKPICGLGPDWAHLARGQLQTMHQAPVQMGTSGVRAGTAPGPWQMAESSLWKGTSFSQGPCAKSAPSSLLHPSVWGTKQSWHAPSQRRNRLRGAPWRCPEAALLTQSHFRPL